MQWAIVALLAQQIAAPGASVPGVGAILVATGRSRDPVLAKSVILLIESDGETAMGLILNRRASQTDYLGGPIAMGTRTLFRSAKKPAGAERIFGDVWMISGRSRMTNARFYSGYTGWSAAQLSAEIARGLWTVRASDAGIVFDAHPTTLWKRSQKPEARSQKPEARSQKPEARSQKPEARSQKPEARSQKPEQTLGFYSGSWLLASDFYEK